MQAKPLDFDVAVLGAGAAGLFFAAEAGRRGSRVIVLDHAEKIGEKIRISGGGRCNFTNLGARPEHFLSQNPKFCISALSRYTPADFVTHVEKAGIAYHEKALGQLFCDGSAQDIIDMLLGDCAAAGVKIRKGVSVGDVVKTADGFELTASTGPVRARNVVVATGGKSIPKIGASGFGYDLATRFGLDIVDPRPALVPLTFEGAIKTMARDLAGVSVEASVTADPQSPVLRGKKARPAAFRDGFLFTHRGLSGPSILQISSYWREGGDVVIDFAPRTDVGSYLIEKKKQGGRAEVGTVLAELLPKRLVQALRSQQNWEGRLADWSDRKLEELGRSVHAWRVTPSGSEGYRTAEVTLGGVSTADLDSRTMEAKSVPGLYFIGEVVDVTGWLGGYNFQWAWSSAFAAAVAVTSGD
jgi:predicted Rossmann fold flavoprotein